MCDGVDDCRAAVRLIRRRDARLIKGAMRRGVASPGPLQVPQFAPEELEAIVREVGRWDMVVTAHCHGERGVRAALEHSNFLNQEAIGMRAEETTLVVTRAVIEFGVANPAARSVESYRKMCEVNEASKRSYAAAIKTGVRVDLGTDLEVGTKQTKFNRGMNELEFEYAAAAGTTPLQAVKAGTAMGPETLGRVEADAVRSGQLKEGYVADFITLSGNPLEDTMLLSNPEPVTHVWQMGSYARKSAEHQVNVLDWAFCEEKFSSGSTFKKRKKKGIKGNMSRQRTLRGRVLDNLAPFADDMLASSCNGCSANTSSRPSGYICYTCYHFRGSSRSGR